MSPELTNCTIVHNASSANGGGVSCVNSASATIEKSIIAFSTNGEAVYCGSGSSAELTCSDVYDNQGGDWIGCLYGQLGIRDNIQLDPQFCWPETNDYTFAKSSPCYTPACGLMGAVPAINECYEENPPDKRGSEPDGDHKPVGNATCLESSGVRVTQHGLAGISFRLQSEGEVSVEIIDLNGRHVCWLADETLSAGEHQRDWNGRNDAGLPLEKGIYLYKVKAGDEVVSGRCILIK